jgi:hypothetical protein
MAEPLPSNTYFAIITQPKAMMGNFFQTPKGEVPAILLG